MFDFMKKKRPPWRRWGFHFVSVVTSMMVLYILWGDFSASVVRKKTRQQKRRLTIDKGDLLSISMYVQC